MSSVGVEMDPAAEAPKTEAEKEKEPKEPQASIRELYQFTPTGDLIAIFAALICASAVGLGNPAMLVAFYSLFEQLGSSTTVPGSSLSPEVMFGLLYQMIYIGVGMQFAQWANTFLIDVTAARQMQVYKQRYLKGVLRQDVAWYDISNPEELASQFADSMLKVQKGFKSVSMIFQGLGYGIGAALLAFLPNFGSPAVAGVTMAAVPILIIAASAFLFVVENGQKTMAKAYAKAGGVAVESLFSMRTITSLGIGGEFQERYRTAVQNVRRTTILNVFAARSFGGIALSSYLVMMIVAILYGAFALAGEIEASKFVFSINETEKFTYYGQEYEREYTIDYCAREGHPAELNNVSVSGLEPFVPDNEPCEVPYYMTCTIGGWLEVAGNTPVVDISEASDEPFPVPDEWKDKTFLETLGFDDLNDFREYVKDRADPEYLKSNPRYFNCSASGSNILITIFAVMMMGEGFGMIGTPFQHFSDARTAVVKVLQICNRVPPIDSFSEEGEKLANVAGTIEVKDVNFAYPSAPDKLVSKNFSLSIAAGETVALCGPSGSGKSTLVQLLERFYDPSSGSVLLDGVDIKTLNVRWLRAQLGLVSQEPMLFSGTVRQNIAYGISTGEFSDEDIIEAAMMANAHEFITALDSGYETQVGHFGSKLSGGQKQRVAIARAIVKRPKVLLLDEATSALDTKSEKIVQGALDEIMAKQKRTTVVIAHRLSTIRTADKICVLREGELAEQGTYDELLQIKDGLFQKLAQRQEALLAEDKAAVAGVSAPVGGEAEGSAAAQLATVVSVDKAVEETESKAEAKSESAPILRIFKMQSDQSLSLILMVVFSAAATAISVWSFYLMAVVMEIVYEADPEVMTTRAVTLCIQLAYFAVAMILAFALSGFFNGLASSQLTIKLRAKGMESLVRQEMGWFDREENSATELTAFLDDKVGKVKQLSSESLDIIAQVAGAFGCFIAVIALYSDWRLLLAWIGMIFVMSAIAPLQAAMITGEDAVETAKKQGKETTDKVAVATTSANQIVGDCTVGIRTVASFNLEQQFYDGFEKSTSQIAAYQKNDAVKKGFFQGFTFLVMFATIGAVFYLGVYLVNENEVDFVEFMSPLMAVTGLMVPMMSMGGLSDIKGASNAAVRLFALFDRVPEIDSLSEAGEKLGEVVGKIEVKDVVFAYPTAPDTLVCKGYSLSIAAGETVALCGPSGSGKSTIINLLERFYDPSSGSISLDGVDIKTLNVMWLRRQLGLVGQEPVLFQGTVRQNIAYGASSEQVVSEDDIIEAAKMANAHEFITANLGAGYDTDVGLKGGKLSGGQKQRVAIARAIVKRPKVLLLDEATSALDNESERIVQAALDEIMAKQKRTTVVIAHRLSTIRAADKIAVVSEGAILEEGTHDELLAMRGMYTKLVMAA